MSSDEKELVITLDSRRLIALGVITVIVVASMYSYIAALFAFIAPSPDLPIHINSVITADGDGNPKDTFSRGSLVMINATIEKGTAYYYESYNFSFTEPTSYLLLVQVMHGDEPVFLGFVSQQIPPGEIQSVGVGYRIGDEDATGEYTAIVYVWSTWLDNGGTVIADNSGQQVSFTVT